MSVMLICKVILDFFRNHNLLYNIFHNTNKIFLQIKDNKVYFALNSLDHDL